MSGKGGSKNNNNNNNRGGNGGSKSSSSSSSCEPTIVTGWQYHQYSQSQPDRYQYLGSKDEDTGEPEFIDYGPKSSRR